MKNFFSTHKLLSIIIIIALLATGSYVIFNNFTNDTADVITFTTANTSVSPNLEESTATTTQPAEQTPSKEITTETSDNVIMCFVGSDKALQNWAYTSSRIEFDRNYPDSLVITNSPQHIAADGNYALDISEKGDASVVGYLTIEDSEVVAHIAGKDGVVMANPNSSYLFGWIVDETNLKEINFNNNFNTVNMKSSFRMFDNSSKLLNLNVSSFDTSNLTDICQMFSNCSSLTELDLSNFYTSNVTDMSGVFSGCNKLNNIDFSNFDTSNVTDMNNMFMGCISITNLNLSHFDTSKVTDMSGMFINTQSLTDVNLSSFNTSNTKDFKEMFEHCYALKSIDISNFIITDDCDADEMFADTLITTIKYKGDTYTSETFGDYLISIGVAKYK